MKMKTKLFVKSYIMLVAILLICAICLSITMVFGTSITANAEEELSDYDRVLLDTIDSLYGEEYDSISITADTLYDLNLNSLGYTYSFSIDGENGYAILVALGEEIRVTEIVFDAISPYEAIVGVPVYIVEMVYAEYVNNKYVINGNEYAYNVLFEAYPNHYQGATNLVESSYSISFVSKDEDEYKQAYTTPSYYNRTGLTNTCACVAGANLISYFDRYQTNLIADYTPGSAIGSIYRYKTSNTTIDGLVSQLYTDMGTNSTGVGTTVPEFVSGMQTYCSRAGYSIDFTNCKAGNVINYSLAKSNILAGKPVVIFVSNFEIATLYEETNKDVYLTYSGQAYHTFVAFGYRDVTYTYSDNTTSQSNFLYVSTSFSDMLRAYLNVNNNLTTDTAYVVNIY